jgi:hypothetical protein
MRGLDPRIHLKNSFAKKMDCRVKPGNDEHLQAFDLPGAGQ